MDAAAILLQLDEAAAQGDFPMLDNAYLQLAAIRLVAFRSPSEWIITFQTAATSLKHDFEFTNSVFAYGNRVATPGIQYGFTPLDSEPRGVPTSPEGTSAKSLDVHDFTLNFPSCHARRFAPTDDDYRTAHVDPYGDAPSSSRILRYLASVCRQCLFLKNSDLLHVIHRSTSDAPVFITLDEWEHPDLADDQLPSDGPCFRSLADALASGEPDGYRCETQRVNSHWWCWGNST